MSSSSDKVPKAPYWPEPKMQVVETDEDLQGPWKSMESRVNMRKSKRTGPSGRTGLKPTDEDAWLAAGLYDIAAENSRAKNDKDPSIKDS